MRANLLVRVPPPPQSSGSATRITHWGARKRPPPPYALIGRAEGRLVPGDPLLHQPVHVLGHLPSVTRPKQPPTPLHRSPLPARETPRPWATCWGVRQGLTDPKPRSVLTPPHRRLPQHRQFYTTRCERTVRQRVDPQTRESKLPLGLRRRRVTDGPSPTSSRTRTDRWGHLENGGVSSRAVGARRLPPGSRAPTFQRGAAAALDPSERGPSSGPPHACSRWSLVLRQGVVRPLQGFAGCRVRPAQASHSRTPGEATHWVGTGHSA